MNKSKVEAILREQGRSKKWLQERLGMTRTTFYYLLKGERPKMGDRIREVAELLGVTMEEII